MKNYFSSVRNRLMLGAPVVLGLATGVTAFASPPSDVPGVAITTEMLAPITDAVTANIGVILPVGIAIFGILIGVGLIPTIISKFAKK